MNQQTYRIIFNKARGCLMAVAETATSQGKGASGERGTHAVRYARPAVTRLLFGVGPLQLACWLCAGAMGWSLPLTHTAQAQTVATRIVADTNAPQAATSHRPHHGQWCGASQHSDPQRGRCEPQHLHPV